MRLLDWTQIVEHGETRWDCANISITKTRRGDYRVWDLEKLDTLAIWSTLAKAKAHGVREIQEAQISC